MSDTSGKLLGYVLEVTPLRDVEFRAEIVSDDGEKFLHMCERESELIRGQRIRFSEKPKTALTCLREAFEVEIL
jgi:hypothetical protein